MDDVPARRRRYTNGGISEQLSTRLLQCLSETELDRWGEDERQNVRENLRWVSDARKAQVVRNQRAGTRRILTMALIGAVATLVAGFGSFIGGVLANGSHSLACPSGYVCTQVAQPTPTANVLP